MAAYERKNRPKTVPATPPEPVKKTPAKTAKQKARAKPVNARERTTYSDKRWKEIERAFKTNPDAAASDIMLAVEKMGYHEDMKAFLEDNEYDDLTDDRTWKQYKRKTTEAYRDRMLDEYKTWAANDQMASAAYSKKRKNNAGKKKKNRARKS